MTHFEHGFYPLAAALLIFHTGRSPGRSMFAQRAFAAEAVSRGQPFARFGILTDHTLSATIRSTPPIQPADVKPIIQFCVLRGCEIGVFAVRARAEGGLLRLRIEAPVPQSPPPDVAALSLFEQRRALIRYKTEIQQWADAESARRNTARAEAEKFESQLPFFLLSKRSEHFSDVANALVRIDRFLMEPAIDPNLAVRRLLLVCTDLVDTRSGQVYPLASRPVAAWVYRERPQRIPGLNPTMFEAVSPAIAWLIANAEAPSGPSRQPSQEVIHK